MKKKLGIVLVGIMVTLLSSITSYANIKDGICKDNVSESILEERMINLDDIIESYLQADTKDELDNLKDEIKDEKKELKDINVEKDAKKVIKDMKSVYSKINSAINNKKSFLANGKEKKEKKANEYIEAAESIVESIKIELLNYKVALVDNANIGDLIRETLHIVVEGDYTLEQLNAIAEKETLTYIEENKVNALAVGFYEDEDNIGKGYDMGRVEYVPYGDWSKAVDVKSGDYSSFKFVNYLEDPVSLTEGTPITEGKGETNIELVKSDILNVESSAIVEVSKDGGALIVKIKEKKDHPFATADENAIAAYTDWCLDNIKSDIDSIDIFVERPSSSVRAILDMDKMKTTNGRYFDSGDIAKSIQNK